MTGDRPTQAVVNDAPASRFNGLHPHTGALVYEDGTPRSPGVHPVTREYSTAQMLFDEMYGGDTRQPLTD